MPRSRVPPLYSIFGLLDLSPPVTTLHKKSTNLFPYSTGGTDEIILLSCVSPFQKCSPLFTLVYGVKRSMTPR